MRQGLLREGLPRLQGKSSLFGGAFFIVRSRQDILEQFPERDLEGHWEISPDADSRWRAAVLEVLLDIRDLFKQGIELQKDEQE